MVEYQTPTNQVNSPNYPSPSTSAGDDNNLRQLIGEISSLVVFSHPIRVFSVKWQLIRTKLYDLNSGLIAAENCHSPAGGPLRDLVSTVAATVAKCRDLASLCISVSFSGKLLMQSELDLIINKLDNHSETMATLFSAVGILSDRFALVVSKPGVGATRDDMRFYVNDLLTRIKIGDCEMKHQALICVNEIVTQDERYVKVVVDMDDFVVQLTRFIESNNPMIQEEAAIAVGVIAGFECTRGVLIGSGVIGPLIRVIEIGTLRAKQNAMKSLQKLTENGDNAWAVSAHGGVTALLGICSGENPGLELTGRACWVLKNLVSVDEIKGFMIEEGAIEITVKLIKNEDEITQIGSTEFIQAIALGDVCVCQLVVKHGGTRGLVRILDPKTSVSFKSRETALRAIENLFFSCLDYVNLVISYGFMDHILYFLQKGDVSMQELAFKSAYRLCKTSDEARKSMGDVGFMPEFVNLLEAKSYDIREMAAEALSIMVTVPKNRKKFAQEDHNIGLVLQLLDPKVGNSGNFKFLLSILYSLTYCNNVRKKIANSGYVKNIENLADSGVSDAKKILRKLSTNRFKNMLNGIWHS